MDAIGPGTRSHQPSKATPSASGSTRMATAATTCSRSRRATSPVRARSNRTGLPLHEDNQTIVKERLYLDKNNKDILHDEVTTIDNAFTRPWTVDKHYVARAQAAMVRIQLPANRTRRSSSARSEYLAERRRQAHAGPQRSAAAGPALFQPSQTVTNAAATMIWLPSVDRCDAGACCRDDHRRAGERRRHEVSRLGRPMAKSDRQPRRQSLGSRPSPWGSRSRRR